MYFNHSTNLEKKIYVLHVILIKSCINILKLLFLLGIKTELVYRKKENNF